MTLNLLSGQWT